MSALECSRKTVLAVLSGALLSGLGLTAVTAPDAAAGARADIEQHLRDKGEAVAKDSPGLDAKGRSVTVRGNIKRLPLHMRPRQSSGPSRYPALVPGATVQGACWARGQHVRAWGAAHNKWVKVKILMVAYPGFYHDWVWGGGLVGDATGGVHNRC